MYGELENAVVRSTVTARGEYITVDDLPSDLHVRADDDIGALPRTYPKFLARKKALKEALLLLRKFEKAFILEALRSNSWNVSQTSRALGMDRRMLAEMTRELRPQSTRSGGPCLRSRETFARTPMCWPGSYLWQIHDLPACNSFACVCASTLNRCKISPQPPLNSGMQLG